MHKIEWLAKGAAADVEDLARMPAASRGCVGTPSREDVRGALSERFERELHALPEGERGAALDALLEGQELGRCEVERIARCEDA